MPDWIRVKLRLKATAEKKAGVCCVLLILAVCFQPARAQLASAPARYEREISLPALSGAREACVSLDGQAAAYANRGPAEITLWADSRPVPFTLTINSPQESAPMPAEIENFHTTAIATAFDLKMPFPSYSSVTLNFAQHNFVLRARVTALGSARVAANFVLFDLTGQGGEARTTMRLGETSAPVLHVDLDKPLPRSALLGASVPADRAEATVFTTVASTAIVQNGPSSTARFRVAQAVPVERVVVHTVTGGDFRRAVTVSAVPVGKEAGARPDEVAGFIQHADLLSGGVLLQADDDAVNAVLPDNQAGPMTVTVAIENGSRPPLNIRRVDLQMRQRQLCFAAWPGVAHWRMFYGSSTLAFTTLGKPGRSLLQREDPVAGLLGPQTLAADFHPFYQRQRSPEQLFLIIAALLALLAGLLAMLLRTVRIPHVRR